MLDCLAVMPFVVVLVYIIIILYFFGWAGVARLIVLHVVFFFLFERKIFLNNLGRSKENNNKVFGRASQGLRIINPIKRKSLVPIGNSDKLSLIQLYIFERSLRPFCFKSELICMLAKKPKGNFNYHIN